MRWHLSNSSSCRKSIIRIQPLLAPSLPLRHLLSTPFSLQSESNVAPAVFSRGRIIRPPLRLLGACSRSSCTSLRKDGRRPTRSLSFSLLLIGSEWQCKQWDTRAQGGERKSSASKSSERSRNTECVYWVEWHRRRTEQKRERERERGGFLDEVVMV